MPLLADFTVDDIAGRPECHPGIEWTHSAVLSSYHHIARDISVVRSRERRARTSACSVRRRRNGRISEYHRGAWYPLPFVFMPSAVVSRVETRWREGRSIRGLQGDRYAAFSDRNALPIC
jgi:hypothetical protein